MPQESQNFPDAFHRVVIKGLYVKEGKLLVCHDFFLSDLPPVWELPGGGLDFGESPQQALTREVKEEMGLTVTSVAKLPLYTWNMRREKTRGMEWYYSFLLAYKFEIKDLSEFTPTDECRDYRFVSKEELQSMTDLAGQLHPIATLFNSADFV